MLLVATAAVLGGCTTIAHEAEKSPLKAAGLPPDSTVLEIFFVSVPLGDPQSNQDLWEEVDEQHFPPALRQNLSQSGFRVGLVGGRIPLTLANLMELDHKPAATADTEPAKLKPLVSPPRVVRRHLQAHCGQRSEVMASGVYDELPVLRCKSGVVGGRSYPKAQGIFALAAWPEPDGRVRLELVPEVHYGPPRQSWVASEGALRLEPGRDRLAFDDLSISATLSPGDLILLSSLSNRPGSIGHSFFTTTTAGKSEQKLLVIRLAQTQHDDLFVSGEPLPLNNVE